MALVKKMNGENMEIVKVKIDKLTIKEVNTMYGKKKKLSILSGKTWYSSWLDHKYTWNHDWKEGIEVEAELVKQEGKNGTIFLNLVDPTRSVSGNKPSSSNMNNVLADIKEKLARIESKLDAFLSDQDKLL